MLATPRTTKTSRGRIPIFERASCICWNPLFSCIHRTFEQTISFIEKVATTKIHEDIANLIAELGIQLRELELERKEDHKIVKLHPFEVASLANLIKAVSLFCNHQYNNINKILINFLTFCCEELNIKWLILHFVYVIWCISLRLNSQNFVPKICIILSAVCN